MTAEVAFTAPGGTAYWVDQRHPQADDANPGTRERPWRTIGRATTALRPGDAVIVRAGVYRETVTPRTGGLPGRRVTYAAYPGDAVVVTGADPAPDGWVRDGDAWRRAWAGPPMPAYADEPHFRRELVVSGGRVLRPVFRREDLRPGTFFVEGPGEAPRAILLRMPDDGPPHDVEVAHRTYLFRPLGGDPEPECGAAGTPGWLRVVGLRFVHAANRAQWGAACFGSEGALVEDVAVEETNGLGIAFGGRGHVFRRTASNRNGQMGWGGACEGCLFEDTEAVGNNWKGHDPAWEAGGGKWHHTRETVLRRHRAAGNDGPGIWLDGTNDRNTIEACTVVGNALAGIMLELETTHTLVQHNRVVGTRFMGYAGAGILSQAASRNAYVHNTVTGNVTGLWLRLDPDRRAEDGANVVLDNVLVGNTATADEEAREVQVEGADAAHARSNRFDGNVYGRLADDGLRVSTFYFRPDPASGPADFRSGDLARWRYLTGEQHAALLDPAALRADGTLMPDAPVRGAAVALPPLDAFGAPAARPRPHADPGADPAGLTPVAQ
ncbi:MAG TPA: right-handed parallel beta-helix repeat-containing protein [Rubricoccaceae bacterium]|nr:right-handed parallel beta-helix repeat-containing protein [Rubricoccaceae bacterium]